MSARARRDARIRQLRSQGWSLDEIAREIGVHRSLVYEVAHPEKRREYRRRRRLYARRGTGWRQLACELGEKAADVGAWAGLIVHAIDRREVPEDARGEARRLIETIAVHGAAASAAAEQLRDLAGETG